MMIKKLKQDIKPLIEKRNERKLIICWIIFLHYIN
jgi:hypothetical protein